jgi:hypothetical protein
MNEKMKVRRAGHEEICIDVRITLRLVLKKQTVRIWMESTWLMCYSCEHINVPSGSRKKGSEFLGQLSN